MPSNPQAKAPDPEDWQTLWSELPYLDQPPAPRPDQPVTDLRFGTFALAAFLSVGIILLLAFVGFMASVVRSFHG